MGVDPQVVRILLRELARVEPDALRVRVGIVRDGYVVHEVVTGPDAVRQGGRGVPRDVVEGVAVQALRHRRGGLLELHVRVRHDDGVEGVRRDARHEEQVKQDESRIVRLDQLRDDGRREGGDGVRDEGS